MFIRDVAEGIGDLAVGAEVFALVVDYAARFHVKGPASTHG